VASSDLDLSQTSDLNVSKLIVWINTWCETHIFDVLSPTYSSQCYVLTYK
jgi:hypothetical protein